MWWWDVFVSSALFSQPSVTDHSKIYSNEYFYLDCCKLYYGAFLDLVQHVRVGFKKNDPNVCNNFNSMMKTN